MTSLIPASPPTPSWAHGKNYDRTLVNDIEDLIERQKHKAVAENLRQKLLRSQESKRPPRQGRGSNLTSTIDKRQTRSFRFPPGCLDLMDVSDCGVNQDTARNQPNLVTSAFVKNGSNISADVHSSTAEYPGNSPLPKYQLNHTTRPSTPPAQVAAVFPATAPTPPSSAPSMAVSPTPVSPSPIKVLREVRVDDGGRVKKHRRQKKNRVAKMVRSWRKDIFKDAVGEGRSDGV